MRVINTFRNDGHGGLFLRVVFVFMFFSFPGGYEGASPLIVSSSFPKSLIGNPLKKMLSLP